MAWSDYRALSFNYHHHLCDAMIHCAEVLMGTTIVESQNFLGNWSFSNREMI